MKNFLYSFIIFFLAIQALQAQQVILYNSNANVDQTIGHACPEDQIEIAYIGLSAQILSIEIPLKDGTVEVQDLNGATGAGATTFNEVDYQGGAGFSSGACPGGVTCPACGCTEPCAPCGIMFITLPTDAISGAIDVYDDVGGSGGSGNYLGSINIVVPNPIVGYGALPNPICTEDEIPLIGTPSGGTFDIQYGNGNPIDETQYFDYTPPAPYAAYDAMFYPNSTPAAGGYSGTPGVITGAGNLSRNIQMSYSVPNSLADGTTCPDVSTGWSSAYPVYQNPPFTATYNQASASAPTPIDPDLVGPPSGSFSPSVVWNQVGSNGVSASYSGTYVTGTDFLGNVAGNGTYTMTTTLDNNGCISQGTGNVVVGTPPTPNFPTEICTTSPTTTFTIDRSDFTTSGTFSIFSCDYYAFRVTCSPYPGAIQQVSGTLGAESYIFDPLAANVPVGTSITITMRLVRDCGGSESTLTFPTPPETHVVAITGPGGVARPTALPLNFCETGNTVDLADPVNGFAITPTSIEIIALTGSQAGTTVLSLNSNPFSFTPNALHVDPNDTEYALIFEGNSGTCVTRDTFNFFIREDIVPTMTGRHSFATLVDEYCEDETPDVLNLTPLPTSGNSGIVSVDGVNVPSGTFDPGAYTTGSHTVRYDFESIYGCQSNVIRTFEINQLPPASLTANGFSGGSFSAPEFCANESSAVLAGSPSGGGFTGIYNGPTLSSPTDNTFDPNAIHSAQGVDSIPAFAFFTYTVTEIATGCSNTDTLLATVNPFSEPDVLGFAADFQYCEGEILTPINITAQDLFNPGIDYSFTGNGVITSNLPYLYFPDSVQVNTTDTVVLTFTNIYNCQTIDTIPIRVDSIPRPVFTNLPAIMCVDDPAIQLQGSPAINTGQGDDFTGVGVVTGSDIGQTPLAEKFFSPPNAGTGLKILTYTFTDNNQCTGSVLDTVDVKPLPAARFIGLETGYCATSPNDTMVPLDTAGSSNFFGLGVINNALGVLSPVTAYAADSAGLKTIYYEYTDTFGCVGLDSQSYFLNDLPTVTIAGVDTGYCRNNGPDLIQGSPLGGNFELIPGLAQVGPGQANYDPAFSALSPTTIEIKYRYTDFNGCQDSSSVFTEIFPEPSATITGLASQYCEVQDTFFLTGSPAGGTFSGPGTNNNPDAFLPFRSGSGIHTVVYSVNDTFFPSLAVSDTLVCTGTASQNVTVNPLPVPSIITPNNNATFCDNDPMQRILGTVSNTTLYADSLYTGSGVYDSIVQVQITIPVPPFNVFVNDTIAFFDPVGAGAGSHQVTYTATNIFGCVDSVTNTYNVLAVPNPDFLIDSVMCESNDPVFLSGTPAGGIFILNGDTLTQNVYEANPNYPTTLLTAPKTDTIVYAVNNAQCGATDTSFVLVNPNPVVNYIGVNTAGDTSWQTCLNQNDTVFLIPNIQGGSFSGPGVPFQGSSFIGDATGVGEYPVNYEYTDTSTGCTDSHLDTFFVYSTPNVSFAYDGGCGNADVVFNVDNGVLGLDGTYLGNQYDSITSIIWYLGDTSNTVRNELPIGNNNQVASIQHFYSPFGVYEAVLYVENRGYCSGTDTVRVIVSPSVQPLDTVPYEENFDVTDGGWFEEAEIGNQSSNLWEWNVASGLEINTTADPIHDMVWVTRASGAYTQNESGWVFSPCFDLTELDRPMFKFDFFNDTDPGNDGVVIEYYDSTTNNWKPFGLTNRGINWYNESVIAGRPGIQDLAPRGWSGRFGEWRDARYKLDEFTNMTNLRLRVAFGAVGVTTDPLEGFAFDNVFVGNRTRNVLLEHFINSSVSNFDVVNQHVYDLVYTTPAVRDVILAQYNVAPSTGTDKFNLENPNAPSARANFYDLSSGGSSIAAGRAIIDGRADGTNTPLSIDLREPNFEFDMLQDPSFDVTIDTFEIVGNMVQVRATVTANEAISGSHYIHIAILEDSMTYFTGERVHSVVRQMLPGNSGQLVTANWQQGTSVTTSLHTWSFDPAVYNSDNFTAIAFIQREGVTDDKVYQAASRRDLTRYIAALGTDELEAAREDAAEINSMNIFPNPSHNIFNVQFEDPLSKGYNWKVVDLRGVILSEGRLEAGDQQLQIEGNDWASGMYIFMVNDKRFRVQRKLVKIK